MSLAQSRLIATLVEDGAHSDFLILCKDLVEALNAECGSQRFRLDTINCRGLQNLVSNALPSWLAFTGRRFLIALDMDSRDREQTLEYIAASLDGAKTKGYVLNSAQPSVHAGWSIRVLRRSDNVIAVQVNGIDKKIVVLPLGLTTLPARVRRHSVEDYMVEKYSYENLGNYSGDSAKDMLNQLMVVKGYTSEKIRECMKDSILLHADEIVNHLRPLWH